MPRLTPETAPALPFLIRSAGAAPSRSRRHAGDYRSTPRTYTRGRLRVSRRPWIVWTTPSSQKRPMRSSRRLRHCGGSFMPSNARSMARTPRCSRRSGFGRRRVRDAPPRCSCSHTLSSLERVGRPTTRTDGGAAGRAGTSHAHTPIAAVVAAVDVVVLSQLRRLHYCPTGWHNVPTLDVPTSSPPSPTLQLTNPFWSSEGVDMRANPSRISRVPQPPTERPQLWTSRPCRQRWLSLYPSASRLRCCVAPALIDGVTYTPHVNSL
jgi:hypothetical protein